MDGGLTYGCTQSFQVESAVPGGPRFPNEALRCAAAYSVVKRAVGDREIDSRQAGCATPRRPARPPQKGELGIRGGALAGQIPGVQDAQSPLERAEEEQRISRRTKALWTGKSFVASRRRGGSGLGESLRIGQRAPRKARPGIEEGIATGASEVGRRVRGLAEQAPTVRRRSAEATVRVVKRAGLRFPWAATRGRARSTKSRDDEPERGGYGCSLTECREAETAQTYLRSRSPGLLQGGSTVRDLARAILPVRVRRPRD